MYTPSAFHETRHEILEDFVRAHPFATLIVQAAEGISINHVPLELIDGVLLGHVARANALAGLDGAPVVAVFHGPQGYISPNWYPSKQETGREVPTWNYAVVHAHGAMRVIDDAAWLRRCLHTLTTHHEADEPRPWSIDDAPADYIDPMLKAIRGIEIPIQRLEGKFKLGQNKSQANRGGVIAGLQRRNRAGDAALAAMTQAVLSL